MLARSRPAFFGCFVLCFAGVLAAQVTPPARDIVAARVNGQAIPELMVYRSLLRMPPQRREEGRKEVLNFLIDNVIVDQYLVQVPIKVEPKEIDESLAKIKSEAAKDKQDFQEILKKLMISEDELRTELTSALRWDKFVLQLGTEKVLQQHFADNIDMFNGSRVRARHILIPIKDGKKDEALAKITAIKKSIDAEVGQTMTKLPATTDAITREKERAKAMEQVFIKTATNESTCPSKKDGGDLGFFARAGDMVEPFARAAFGLKQYQMSGPVPTEFGYHLILAVDSKPGTEVTFEKIKPNVQEVYAERLREAVLAAYKPKAKIEMVPKSRE